MKIPKKIRIFGYVFRITYKKTVPYYGSFDIARSTIILNKDCSITDIKHTLLHEIMEIITVLMGRRFRNKNKQLYMSFYHDPYDRDEFSTFTTCLHDTLTRNNLGGIFNEE